MKTAALIAGVFLLALTFTIVDALDKKQDVCPISGELEACFEAFTNGTTINVNALCTATCRSELTEYFRDCFGGAGFDQFNQEYTQLCGSSATVGITLFAIVSALLVAVFGN